MFNKEKTKLEKLQEKYDLEKDGYKKDQLLYKIKSLTKGLSWNTLKNGTYRKYMNRKEERNKK